MTRSPKFLLDTNAISSTRRPGRDTKTSSFFEAVEPSAVFLSVLTLGELRRGAVVKARRAKDGVGALTRWIDKIEADYRDRLIPVNEEIAKLWGEFTAQRSLDPIDTLIGATAIVHDMTLVTRNVRDFSDLPVKLHNPWLD